MAVEMSEHHKFSGYLNVRAKQWDTRNKNADYLLRGQELSDAQEWLEDSETFETKPSELLIAYIHASIQEEESAQNEQQARELAQIKRQQQLIELQLATRNSLSQEFRDNYPGFVTNFIMQAEIVERLWSRKPEMAFQELRALKEQASRVLSGIRTLTWRLSSHHIRSGQQHISFESIASSYLIRLGQFYQCIVLSRFNIVDNSVLKPSLIFVILESIENLFRANFYQQHSRTMEEPDADIRPTVLVTIEVTVQKAQISFRTEFKPALNDTLNTWLEICEGKLEIVEINPIEFASIITIPITDSPLFAVDAL